MFLKNPEYYNKQNNGNANNNQGIFFPFIKSYP